MGCERFRVLISDEVDGALSDGQRQRLGAHVEGCPACREYRRTLLRLQAESRRDEASPPAADYYERFSAAVESRLRREERVASRPVPGWKKAWVLAPLVLAVVIGVVLFRGGGGGGRHEIFSFEDCLDRIFWEIGGDDEAAADFDSYLSGALLEGGDGVILEEDVNVWDEPLIWRSLSDEDLRSIEEGLREEIRS